MGRTGFQVGEQLWNRRYVLRLTDSISVLLEPASSHCKRPLMAVG